MQYIGSIFQGDELKFEYVPCDLELKVSRTEKTWRGRFVLPADTWIGIGPYRLVLNDGRKCDVMLEDDYFGHENGTVAEFLVSEQPKQPTQS